MRAKHEWSRWLIALGASSLAAASCLTSFPEPRADSDAADASLDVLIESGGSCEGGGKLCGEACVPTDDPAFGCASGFCNACALPHAVAKCSGGSCALGACLPGFDDCDGVSDNGCEAELAVDPNHCSACDHGCGGGGCSAGKCQPVLLAGTQTNPWAVAVDATHVYWTNANGATNLCRQAHGAAGGAIEALSTTIGGEGALALDADYVYWANEEAGTVRRLSKQSPASPPLTLATGDNPIGVALDDQWVYWTDLGTAASDGSVSRVAKSGGTSNVLATGLTSPLLVTLDATHVYFTSLRVGSVHRVPKTGGSAVELAPGSDPTPANIAGWGIALHQGSVLWLDTPLLRSVPAGGGVSTTLRDDQPQGRFMATLGSTLSWASGNFDQSFIWLGSVEDPALAVSLVGPIQNAHGITLDETYVYFTQWGSTSGASDGGVFKVARP